MQLELESQASPSPDDLSPNRKFHVGGGGIATLTVTTNHNTNFSINDQENEEPSPMNWDNLNRILRDIEFELEQNDVDDFPLNLRKHQATRPLRSTSSHEKTDDSSNRHSTKNKSAKKSLSTQSQTHHGTHYTPNPNPQCMQKKSKRKEMKGILHYRHSVSKEPACNLAATESSTITTTQTQSGSGSHHPDGHRENVKKKEIRESTKDRSVVADDAAGDRMNAFEDDEDKERAVNALIKRMFEELAAEMVGDIQLVQKSEGKDAYQQDAARGIEGKKYEGKRDREITDMEARDPSESPDGDLAEVHKYEDNGGSETIDMEERDPTENSDGDLPDVMNYEDYGDRETIDMEAYLTENTDGDIIVASSECNRDENDVEEPRFTNNKISGQNDDIEHDDSKCEEELTDDNHRDDAESEERRQRSLENAVSAAAAEVERRRKEDEEIKRRQAEETERMLAEERQRKEILELVKTILHANSGNETNAYYKVLGVSPTCSIGIIKKAYRKLALKLHPDKEKYNTPKADEAFKAVSHAYDILKDEALRNEYDRTQNRSVATPTTSASMPNNGPMIPIILPNGTRITIQSKDIRFAHFNGLQGCVVNYDDSSDLYTIQIDDHCTTTKSKITALFRNVTVCLRAAKANELGVFLATLVSYYKDDRGGLYQARYNIVGGKRGSVYLRSEQFIIPNGTVVGLQCGNYGTIVDWREEIDQYTRADVSYYKVKLYNDIFTRVQMKNIRL